MPTDEGERIKQRIIDERKGTRMPGRTRTRNSNPPVPRSSEEMRDYLSTPGNLRKFDGPEGLANWIDEYAAGQTDVTAQAEEMAEAQLIQMMRDGKLDPLVNRVPTGENDTSRRSNRLRGLAAKGDPNRYNRNAPGARLDGMNEFRDSSLGDIMCAILRHKDGMGTAEERRMTSKMSEAFDLVNSMGSVIPSDGGFLIPEQTRADILSLALEESIVRSRATVFPMKSLTLGVPTIDETSHATNIYGGISYSFTPESGTISASQPRFGKVKLEAGKLAFFTNIPNELMDDAPALNVWLNARLPSSYSWYEDGFFLTGSGVGEPLGVINAPARVSVDRVGSSTDTLVYEDVLAMYCRMLPRSINKAVWIVSNECIPSLYLMVVKVLNVAGDQNVGGAPVMIHTASGPAPTTLFGRPILYTEHASQLGTEGDITFADLSEYIIGDRMAITMKTSTDFRFQNDETSVRGIARVDGKPWLPSAITPRNGGDTLSAYVTLAN